MDSNYDEDVNDNPFLRDLRKDYASIIEQATQEGWIICIPRCGSFVESALDEDYVNGHILVPNQDMPTTRFHTLNNKEVKLANKMLTIEYDNGKLLSSRLLFEETFYGPDLRKYRVWCIEHPLETVTLETENGIVTISNIREAKNFLWEELNEKTLMETLEITLEEFKSINSDLENKPLQIQRDSINSLYSNILEILLKDNGLKDKSTNNKHFQWNLKISVETYILYALRNILPQSVSAATASEDANLNKIIRNLRELQLRDLGVRADLHEGVHRGKLELSRLDRVATILEKIECLKKAVRYVSQGKMAVSSDDLLPVLIFLVIKTGLPNWTAQVAFMKQFRFSVNSIYEADEAGFLITSLEAAIEHIKSGVLIDSSEISIGTNRILSTTNNFQNDSDITDSAEETSLNYLFACIKKGDAYEVEKMMLNETAEPSQVTLCHPLCTCETCKNNLAKEYELNRLSVDSKDDRGTAPLHIASSYGHVAIVDFLLSHDADPNITDSDGVTPLHCASMKGHQNTILLLLHTNADPNVSDIRHNTPLHLAADHGHEGCVKALLYFAEQMRLPLNVNAANINGDTPLHHASKWGYAGIVEILLEYGANCRATNKRGQTALAIAHSKPVLKLLEQAVSNDVHLNPINRQELQHTSQRESRFEVQRLNDTEESKTYTDEAKIKSVNSIVLRHTVDKLLSAIAEGDICLAYYYLGLEGRCRTTSTRTDLCHPLCNCEKCGSIEETSERPRTTPALAINSANSNNETALHVACATGCTEIVQSLLDAGANIHIKTKSEGRTPLHLACLRNNVKVVKLLLNCASCDVDIKDHNGDTPLHLVTKTGNAKLVEILVRCGANPRIRNLQGVTPLQNAEKNMSNDSFSSMAFSNIVKMLKRNSVQSIEC